MTAPGWVYEAFLAYAGIFCLVLTFMAIAQRRDSRECRYEPDWAECTEEWAAIVAAIEGAPLDGVLSEDFRRWERELS